MELGSEILIEMGDSFVGPHLKMSESLPRFKTMSAIKVRAKLRSLASPDNAKASARYFGIVPGKYGEGDTLIGVRVPALRKLAREFQSLPLTEVETLLQSSIHEERLLALLILVRVVDKCSTDTRKTVFGLYLSNTQHVNNWDLVDRSAPAIAGGWLFDKSRQPLIRLANSANLWERRIAIVATQYFIRLNDFDETLKICKLLLADQEDLIHKATGWMLREVGKRNRLVLEQFLDEYGFTMPRTMLRYAIEHLLPHRRREYLAR